MKRYWPQMALAATLWACAHPAPEKPPIQLNLELAEQVTPNANIRYRLELRNTGRVRIAIDDPFWCHQIYLRDPKTSTFFRILDSSGTEHDPHFQPRSLHSPFRPWSNDLKGHACQMGRLPLWIEPQRSLFPTPTIPEGAKIPEGFRVLEGYEDLPPGLYTIEAVFEQLMDPKKPIYVSPPVTFEVVQ